MELHNQQLFIKIVFKMKADLPSLPSTITNLVKMAAAPDQYAASDLAQVIEKDPAMTSKILRLANSAYYGFSSQIKTISHSIVCLGFDKVKSMAYTVDSNKILQGELKSYGMKEGALFKHSVATAITSRLIASNVEEVDPEEIYIMGLLHDIGKFMIDQYASKEFEAVLESYKSGSRPFYEAEKMVLGFDHGEIGDEVGKKWNFPEEICEVIKYHHRPMDANVNKMNVHIVCLANGIAKTLDVGDFKSTIENPVIEMKEVFNEDIMDFIGINRNEILDIRKQASDEYQQVDRDLLQ